MADYITYLRTMVGHEAVIMAAACAVIEDGGRILLQKRPSGLWGLPGGIAELGEALHETAVREAFEETGLITEARELVGIYSKYDVECTNGDKLQPVTALFRVEVVGGELRCDENETLELRYFGKEELPEIYCKQHSDMIDDWFAKRRGVFR